MPSDCLDRSRYLVVATLLERATASLGGRAQRSANFWETGAFPLKGGRVSVGLGIFRDFSRYAVTDIRDFQWYAVTDIRDFSGTQ